ncbi:MAG: single-stranded-DNA-specific exonuclease RecJ, partial [Chloroflexota bacterium]|nr:single-stranded-DNA-specific exonuclease RecJ [Chloroflexota bacterium]
ADKRLSADPFLLPDMDRAVARIYRALLSGESIAVYGDFDVDGVTSTALLVQGLTGLGAKVTPYIPHRLTEGYGLSSDALANLHKQGISLVITVDCGITGVPQVKKAGKIGLDIVITDHHTPLEELPPATAVVNPKLPGSAYPFPGLAGVGVALKLLQALYQSLGKEDQLDGVGDLVALGTVADMMPLLGENRHLVKYGLKLINTSPRLGVRELMTQCGLNAGSLDSETISWVIAPRLNTPGRLEHAMSSYQLLTTNSVPEAQELSRWLEEKNTERQKLTAEALARARQQVLAEGIAPLLVTGDSDCPAGIAGLVAGRLCEEFYRPAIAVRVGDFMSTGSCRSIPEFNIVLALDQCRNLLSRFGGHPQAAGFSLLTRNLPRLKEQLSQLAATQLAKVDLRPVIEIDAQVSLSDLGGSTFPTIQQLAPFGCGNPAPTFLSRAVNVVDCRTMSAGGDHLRLKLQQGHTTWDAVAFRLGCHLDEVLSPLDIVYNLEIDHWGGGHMLRLNILDFAPASQERSCE